MKISGRCSHSIGGRGARRAAGGGRFGSRAQGRRRWPGIDPREFLAPHDDQDKDKHGSDPKDKSSSDDSEFTERDEFRQSYTLAAGATVASPASTAAWTWRRRARRGEVHVVRSARNSPTSTTTDHRRADGLRPRRPRREGEEQLLDRDGDGGGAPAHHHAHPAQRGLHASGINGRHRPARSKPVRLSGSTGAWSGAGARLHRHPGINGSVTMFISQLTERGVRVPASTAASR